MTKQALTLSKEEFAHLLKLVYLGNWMVNAHRAGDEVVGEYDKVESFVFSQAQNFGLGDCCSEGMYPSREFEEDEELIQYQEEYDQAAFIRGMVTLLATRAVSTQLSEDEFIALSDEQRFEIFNSVEEQVATVLSKDGFSSIHFDAEITIPRFQESKAAVIDGSLQELLGQESR